VRYLVCYADRQEVSMNRARPRRVTAPDGGDAFVLDFRSGFAPIRDGDTEAFARVFILGATSNDAVSELARDEVHVGEMGGLVFDLEDEDASAPPDFD